jgi:hypothetical protein
MFSWNKKNIDWFIASSTYSSFHKNLAKLISNKIDSDSTLLDIGAGLGRLEEELSDCCKKITMIEPNKAAYEFLLKNRKSNFEIINTTYEEYEITKHYTSDYLLLSFFSRMDTEDNYERLSKLCNKKIIYIRNESHGSNKALINYLDNKGISYSFERHEIDFSQPLQLSEVDDFIDTYYRSKSIDEKKKLKDRVIKKDNNYLFINKKQISIFTIEKKIYEEI